MAFVGQYFCKCMEVNSLAMQGNLQGLFCVPEKLQYSKKRTRRTQVR
jgi:hypothetical protein